MAIRLAQRQKADSVHRFPADRSAREVEQIVVMVRLELYNRGVPCGAGALRRTLLADGGIRPLPSECMIQTSPARAT